MAARVCWFCKNASHQTERGEAIRSDQAKQYFRLFQCDQCGVGSLGHLPVGAVPAGHSAKDKLRDSPLTEWLPERFSGRIYEDVPGHIASAANEAHVCMSAQAYRAAIMLARAVVEATAKERGYASGTLAAKIEMLYENGHVRELIKHTADEIRYLGNDMAHGDFVDDVTADEADDVLAFMAEVLNEVYQAPARVNARRDARLARAAED